MVESDGVAEAAAASWGKNIDGGSSVSVLRSIFGDDDTQGTRVDLMSKRLC